MCALSFKALYSCWPKQATRWDPNSLSSRTTRLTWSKQKPANHFIHCMRGAWAGGLGPRKVSWISSYWLTQIVAYLVMCSPSTASLKSATVGVFTPSHWQMLQSRLFVFPTQRAGFSAVAHGRLRTSYTGEARKGNICTPLRPSDFSRLPCSEGPGRLILNRTDYRDRKRGKDDIRIRNLRTIFAESILFNLFRGVGLTGFSRVPRRLVFTEQIRIISVICHFWNCKGEGGTFILHLLINLPIIFF